MKFNTRRWGVAAMSVALLGLFASCGGNKSESGEKVTESQLEDSLRALEEVNVEREASAQDSLQAIDDMVSAVEDNEAVSEDWSSKYNASFFTNEKNKSAQATSSSYAVTPSGLKYAVVEKGSGKKPGPTSMVTVHYTGTLTDGTVFDSSVARGEPTSFPLNRVIPGWTEGLQLMQEGGTTVFYIPSNLAYGEHGAPPMIPPSAPLIFWVQLLQVN